MRLIYTLLFLTFICAAFAQNHNFHCYLGYANGNSDPKLGGMTISFTTNPPTVFTEKKEVDFGAYSAVCSDSSGQQVLFYTNGISIRNRLHHLMQNGDTINPGYLWQSFQHQAYQGDPRLCFFPAPGLPNQYYLIHLATKFDPFSTYGYAQMPLYYSLIDMNANNGLGRVVKKNQILVDSTTDNLNLIGPAAVKHGNGRDWWIVTGRYNSNELIVFLFSPTGISGPFIQHIGPPYPQTEGRGTPLFTPDGNTYIRGDSRNGPRIYDFDRCTGQLSNLRIVPFTYPLGFEYAISPNSRFLYSSMVEFVVQFDLQAGDIGASMDTVAVYDGFTSPYVPWETAFNLAGLQPDGKIYYSNSTSTTALNVINRPDLPGLACDVQQHGIILPKFNHWTVTHNPNYRLGEWEAAPCDTLNAQQPNDGFVRNPYHPSAFPNDTTYRLCTPVPDKTQSPDIYFHRPRLPDTPIPSTFRYMPGGVMQEDKQEWLQFYQNRQ